MKHLVIGAGATLAEALALGNTPETCPPLIRDFARKTWLNYSPHPVLEVYLQGLGYENLGHDPRELFYELEAKSITNIEHFMEFAWENRNRKFEVSKAPPPGYISGLRITTAGGPAPSATASEDGGFWSDLLYHGIGSPLSFFMGQCFFENGKGWRDFSLSKSVATLLSPEDLVFNLNYDTIFELALVQLGRPFAYSPNHAQADQLLICKPHGSLNMVANDTSFAFGQPEWLGMPQPQGYRSYSGLIPPRFNKHYTQHPIAQMILAPVDNRKPQAIIMWGVGLTSSDQDLIALYVRWAEHSEVVDIINPSLEVAARAKELFECNVRHFANVQDWTRQPR